MKNTLLIILFFTCIDSALADQRRYSLDSMFGNLAEKFKGQMLTRADYSKISRVKPNQYRIPKELKMKALISIPKLVQQGKVVKKLGTAGSAGYVITYLEKDSVYQKLGLQVGDFLSKINGAPLTDDKQIMQVFNNNKGADNIRLELVRQKAKITIFYQFI